MIADETDSNDHDTQASESYSLHSAFGSVKSASIKSEVGDVSHSHSARTDH